MARYYLRASMAVRGAARKIETTRRAAAAGSPPWSVAVGPRVDETTISSTCPNRASGRPRCSINARNHFPRR
jgi:hypothetical protein